MESNNKIYYITLQKIFDEDWQTQLAQGYPQSQKVKRFYI